MTRQRPFAVTLLGVLGLANGVVALGLATATLRGSQLLYQSGGMGPNRVAPAALLGPLAPRAGWVLLVLAVGLLAIGGALLSLRPWARQMLATVLAVISVATMVGVVWGVVHGAWGLVVVGLVKLTIIVATWTYLRSTRVRDAFVAPAI